MRGQEVHAKTRSVQVVSVEVERHRDLRTRRHARLRVARSAEVLLREEYAPRECVLRRIRQHEIAVINLEPGFVTTERMVTDMGAFGFDAAAGFFGAGWDETFFGAAFAGEG